MSKDKIRARAKRDGVSYNESLRRMLEEQERAEPRPVNYDANYGPEYIELATHGVAMVTEIEPDEVLYQVVVGGCLSDADRSGCRTAWQRVVRFGKTERFHAGGQAFVETARLQAAVAEEFVRLAGER